MGLRVGTVLIGLLALPVPARADPVFVLGPEAAAANLDLRALERLLLGISRVSAHGTSLELVLPPSHNVALEKCLSLRFKMSMTTFQKHWIRVTLRGAATPPRQLEVAGVLQHLKTHPAAVTVLDHEGVPQSLQMISCEDD